MAHRFDTTADKALFSASASPQAIAAHLAQSREQRRQWDRQIQWLEKLLVNRSLEASSGMWPPAADKTTKESNQ